MKKIFLIILILYLYNIPIRGYSETLGQDNSQASVGFVGTYVPISPPKVPDYGSDKLPDTGTEDSGIFELCGIALINLAILYKIKNKQGA